MLILTYLSGYSDSTVIQKQCTPFDQQIQAFHCTTVKDQITAILQVYSRVTTAKDNNNTSVSGSYGTVWSGFLRPIVYN